jgi:YtcA-like protein
MIGNKTSSLVSGGIWGTLLLLEGCSRAPSFDIMGSFFPAWLVCFVVSILVTALFRSVLLRFRISVALPVLVYPSLTALFSFVLWLIFFR